jgi:hypothetical protein
MFQFICTPDLPAVHVIAEIGAQTGIAPAPAGEGLQLGKAIALGAGDVFLAELLRFAQRAEFGAAFEGLLDGVGQFDVEGRDFERVGQLQGDVFPDFPRQIVAEQLHQIVLGDAMIVAGADEGGRALATATSARRTLKRGTVPAS